MVQVLPEVPSFGKQFAQNLGAGVSKGLDFSGQVALQNQKQSQKQNFYNDLFGSKQGSKSPGEQLKSNQENEFTLSPEQETMLALSHPQEFNAYKHLKEERGKAREETRKKENLQETMGEMTKTLLGGNLGYTPKRLGKAQGRRDSQYFDSLGVQLESIGKDLVSKGVLSQARFAYLLSNLPSSHKTDATNAGALEAWYKELGMEPPEELKSLYQSKSKKKSSSSKNQSSKKTSISDDEARAILKEAGGDPDRAEQIALDRGLVF